MQARKKGRWQASPEVSCNVKRESTQVANELQREAAQWLLDAFVYERDGEHSKACVAALRGVCAIRRQHGRG